MFLFFRIIGAMYDHYVKFEKYGTVHRGKEKAPAVGHREVKVVLILGERGMA